MFKLFDLDFAENKVCKKYRKDIFKKIAGLTYSEKRKVILKVDHGQEERKSAFRD